MFQGPYWTREAFLGCCQDPPPPSQPRPGGVQGGPLHRAQRPIQACPKCASVANCDSEIPVTVPSSGSRGGGRALEEASRGVGGQHSALGLVARGSSWQGQLGQEG